MALAITDFFNGGMSLRDRLEAKMEEMRKSRQMLEKYNRTFRELDQMTDRDLRDIGITRGDIPQISREAAYGAES